MDVATTLMRDAGLAGGGKDLLLEGLVQQSLGRDGPALEAFENLIRSGRRSTLAVLCAAQLLLRRREAAKAASLLEDLVGREPGLAEAHRLLGQAYLGLYRNLEAAASLRAALALEPGDGKTRAALEALSDVQEP